MIYSESKRFLFVHIPKTAGTSIRSVIEPYGVHDYEHLVRDEDNPDTRVIRRYLDEKGHPPPHLNVRDIYRYMSIPLNDCFKFAFVRNPFERLHSLYQFCKRDPNHAMHALCKDNDFDHFIDRVGAHQEVTFEVAPQISWLLNDRFFLGVDYVARFEDLDKEMAGICNHLGLPAPENAPRLNVSPGKAGYREAYSDRSRQIVQTLCTIEIALLGYRF